MDEDDIDVDAAAAADGTSFYGRIAPRDWWFVHVCDSRACYGVLCRCGG